MKIKVLFTSIMMLAAVSLFAQEENAPVKKYGFKSAIAKYTTDMMGQKVESTTYIDEYGAKECQKVKLDIPGMGSMESGSITKEGKIWSVNYTMKQVQEVEINPEDQPNLLDPTEEQQKKFKIKAVCKEKFLDLDCEVYTLETEAQGITAKLKVWAYKGFALKTITEASGMVITSTATEFKEDAVVLPQVFDVPKY